MANTKVTTNVIADDAITLDKMAGLARGKIIYGDSSGNPAALAVGSNGQVLKSDGTDISWGTDSSNDRDGAAVFNESGAAVDFRIEGDTVENLFFVDGSADKIGIGTNSPDRLLTLQGDNSYMWIKDAGGGNVGFIGGSGENDGLMRLYKGDHNAKVEIHSDAASYFNGGDVGIGTSSPSSKLTVTEAGDGNSPTLHVKDTADSEGAWFEGQRAADTGAFISVYHNPSTIAESNRSGIRFQGGNDAGQKVNYGVILQRHTDYTDGTEDGELQIHQMVNGTLEEKVAITPDQLRLKGDAGSSFIRVDNRADGHDTGFEIYQNGSRKWEIHSDDSNSDALDFRPAGVQKFTFTQDGELGIGNTNPGGMHSMVNRLVVGSGSGNQGLAIYSGAGSEGAIGFARDIAANTDAYDGLIEYSQADRSFRFGTNAGTERMRLKTGLSIGSATDPGSQNLFVAGVVRVGDNSPSIAGHITVQGSNAGVPILYAKNTNADSLGIRAEVNNNTSNNAILEAVNTDGQQWKIRNDGDHFGTDTSIGSISDSRLKKDESDLTYDIAKFKQYRPVEFNWINPNLHRSASGKTRGFLAQEVKALDDYYVDQYDAQGDDIPLVDSDGKAHSTKFGYKDAMYISVIKQLITRLETAEAKIAELESS